MNVWAIVDRELHRRRQSWSDLGRGIGATDQTLHNWSKRKVPATRYADIAAFFGWTVEQVMGLAPEPSRAEPAPVVAAPVYTKRANDIATMFDELKDPKVRQAAYAGVTAILQMAKAGQRLPDAVPLPVEPTSEVQVPTYLRPAPAPKPARPKI